MTIDVDALKARVSLVDVVGSYVTLKKVGKEYRGLCPFHPDTNPSFYVVPEKGFCHCFSCGWPNNKSGDVIAFIEDIESLDFAAACLRLGAKDDWTPRIQTPQRPKIPDRITSKPPKDAPTPSFKLRDLGEPSVIWPYLDADGSLLGYVTRYETGNGSSRKEIRCFSWGARGDEPPAWACGAFSKPRPLYRLDKLAARPAAPVLVVEGEKAADAAARLLPGYVACTWSGGAQAWKHSDWEPLRGRKVLLWPDHDSPGLDAMRGLAAILADPRGLGCSVRIIDPNRQPEGWDAANAEAEGMDTAAVIAWAKPRATDYITPLAPAERPSESAESAAPPASPPPVASGPNTAGVAPDEARRRPEAPEDASSQQADAVAMALDSVNGTGGSDDEVLPAEMSEDALADAFAAQHEDSWRYVKQWNQWFSYESDTWKPDQTELIDRLAVELCRSACYWPQAKGLTAKERRLVSTRRVAGAVRDIARNDRRLACSAERWDADPLLVGLPSGVFDVRTGQVIRGVREHYITKRCAFMPEPGRPERWLGHLDRMMAGDAGMIEFLRLFAGYCATGDTSEQCFLFLYGQGQTGKGTFLLTVGEVLGDYTRAASASTFMASESERHSSEIARLIGCRLVVVDETEGTKRWNEARVKSITGGGRVTAARKYHDETDIPVTWKLAFAGNHKPALHGVGKEMERRIRLVRCVSSIPDEEVDRNFRADMVAAEGPQILNWILEGAVAWHQSRLPLPESIIDATRDYLAAEDVIGDWLLEACEQAGETIRPAAHKAFTQWQSARGDKTWSSRAWWSALEDRGYTARKSNGAWLVRGLTLKSEAPATPPRGYASRED